MTTRELRLTEHARNDLHHLHATDPEALRAALEVLVRLTRDTSPGIPLRSFAKTGDLTDCFKAYVDVPGRGATHRVVFREHDDGTIIIVEVVAVAPRADDLAYVLASLRLGRLDDPARRAEAIRRVSRHREVDENDAG